LVIESSLNLSKGNKEERENQSQRRMESKAHHAIKRRMCELGEGNEKSMLTYIWNRSNIFGE